MLYYKVAGNVDEKFGNKTLFRNPQKAGDEWELYPGELLTAKQVKRYNIPNMYLENKVNLSRDEIYYFFGKRFANN